MSASVAAMVRWPAARRDSFGLRLEGSGSVVAAQPPANGMRAPRTPKAKRIRIAIDSWGDFQPLQFLWIQRSPVRAGVAVPSGFAVNTLEVSGSSRVRRYRRILQNALHWQPLSACDPVVKSIPITDRTCKPMSGAWIDRPPFQSTAVSRPTRPIVWLKSWEAKAPTS